MTLASSKTFIFGALTGIAASTLVYWSIDSPQERSASADPTERQSTTGTESERATDQPGGLVPVERGLPSTAGERAPASSNSDVNHLPEPHVASGAATDQSRNIQSSVADTTKRPGLNGDTPSTTADTSATARDARAKEPIDQSWAHYMEQTLSQYLASHPKASQFDITSVNCRSSFCEVVAVGFDESTWPVWQQVMHDVKQQPWSEFGQIGSSLESREGRVILNATLHRLLRE